MKVLREAVSIILGVLLILGVVGKAVTASTIYDIEMDKRYASETRDKLEGQEKQMEERLAQARREGDLIEIAQCEMMLDAIRLIEARVNPVAIARDVDRTKQAFLEDEWNKFKADTVIGIAGYGLNKIGFGKVTGAYMKGENWPPSSNFLTYDPLTQEKVRIILGNRPNLTAITFSDDIADLGGMILEIFDALRSGRKKDKDQMSASEAWTFVTEHLGKLEGMRPLPKDLGVYIAISMIKQGLQEGSHIPEEEKREDFARDRACQRLQKMLTEYPLKSDKDHDGFEALKAAMELVCASKSESSTAVVVKESPSEIDKEEVSAEKTGNSSYEGYYEGIVKLSKPGVGSSEVLNSKAVLEVVGDTVTVTIAYSIQWEAIIARDGTVVCFATLAPIYKGEGKIDDPLTIELVLEGYDLKAEGEGCGNYKESYEKDLPVGTTTTLTGTFVDGNSFEGSFLNLDLIVSKP